MAGVSQRAFKRTLGSVLKSGFKPGFGSVQKTLGKAGVHLSGDPKKSASYRLTEGQVKKAVTALQEAGMTRREVRPATVYERAKRNEPASGAPKMAKAYLRERQKEEAEKQARVDAVMKREPVSGGNSKPRAGAASATTSAIPIPRPARPIPRTIDTATNIPAAPPARPAPEPTVHRPKPIITDLPID